MLTNRMRRLFSIASASCLALTLFSMNPPSAEAADTPSAPQTIPAVANYTAAEATWTLNKTGKIIVRNDVSTEDGETLAQEIGNILKQPAMTVVRDGDAAAGDIVLTTGTVVGLTSTEGYGLAVQDGALVITGNSTDGTWWGTRTLLQVVRAKAEGDVTFTGSVTDEPKYPERLVMIDTGRKYFTPDFMKRQIRQMSYLKLNRLQLHLSEGTGFHIDSKVAPDAVTQPAWSADDIAGIRAVARQYHVEIIPEIDTPGHMDNLLKNHPEWQLTVNGKKSKGKLDLNVPEARQFAKDLLTEAMELFPESKVVHIGGDEYLPAPWEMNSVFNPITNSSAPSLVEYANEGNAEGGLGVKDAYAKYMNELGDHVRSKGKIARMWNDDVYPSNPGIKVDTQTQLSQWIRWNNSKPNTSDYVDAGYEVVNANGDYLYYILTNNDGGAGDGLGKGPNKNPQGIYERWTPRTFMGRAGNGGNYILPEGKPMLGAHMSIWCDKQDAQTEEDIAERFPEWMRAFSQQVWGSNKLVEKQADFEAQIASVVGNAPEPQAGTDPGTDPQPPALSGPGLPAVFPGLRDYQPEEGATPWTINDQTRILITSEDLRADAQLVAKEIATIRNVTPPEIVVGTTDDAAAHDIVLNLTTDIGIDTPEGYTLDTRGTGAVISGTTKDGVFWGTRTLLQSIQSSGGAQNALVRDWPEIKERSFHIDVARKYYSPQFFEKLIPQLAWRKLNSLQYHFSENEGFRLESKTHPEILSTEYITQEELKEIIALATKYHIVITPALDMPGHLRQVLNAHPDLRLADTREGRNGLNYAKPEARQLMKDLLSEFAPLFPSDSWHLGADEFIDFAKAQTWNTYPDLKRYAKEVTGSGTATVADGFTAFINEMIDHLETLGKTDVRVWNDGFYREDTTQKVELSKNATIDYWTAWDRNMTPLKTFIDKGYKVINFNDKYMYYVLYYPGGAYHNRPQPDVVWNEYHPGVFPSHPTTGAQTYDSPYPEWLRGASFAIWSDNAAMETEDQVYTNSTALVDSYASRAWAPEDERDYSQFTSDVKKSGRAPILPKDLKVLLGSELTAEPAPGNVASQTPIDYTATVTNNTSKQAVDAVVTVNSTASAPNLKAADVAVRILESDGEPVKNPAKNVAAASEGGKVTVSGVEEISPGVESSFVAKNAIDVVKPTVENGVITWKGTLEAGQRVELKWTGKAPKDPVVGADPASAKVTLDATATAQGFSGEAEQRSVTHTVVGSAFGVTPQGAQSIEVKQKEQFTVDITGAKPDSDVVFTLTPGDGALATKHVKGAEESVSVDVPCTVKPGDYTLVVTNGEHRVELPIKVVANPTACEPPTEPTKPGMGVFRVGGKNRYMTATEVAKMYKDGAEVVYVATGKTFPDALAVSAIAGANDAPLLLVAPNKLDPAVGEAIQSLNPQKIVMVGGKGAISARVARGLKALGVSSVERVGGSDRYDTAAELAKSAYPDGAPVVYLALGANYPDVLAASAAAAHEGGPVLLATRDTLPAATKDALQRLAPEKVVIVGGSGAISTKVGNEAAGLAKKESVRYSGVNRYATAQVVAQRVFTDKPVAWSVVASGQDFPDAIAGAAFAGMKDGPVLLTDPQMLSGETAIALRALKPQSVMIVGGKGAVSDEVMRAVSVVSGLELK